MAVGSSLIPVGVVNDDVDVDVDDDDDVGSDGGDVTFAVGSGINFFTAGDGAVVAASLLFDFDLTVTKFVNDVCNVGFFVVVVVVATGIGTDVVDISVTLAPTVAGANCAAEGDVDNAKPPLERVLIADLSGDRDLLSAAAARVFGKRTFTDVTFPKFDGFVLFSTATSLL